MVPSNLAMAMINTLRLHPFVARTKDAKGESSSVFKCAKILSRLNFQLNKVLSVRQSRVSLQLFEKIPLILWIKQADKHMRNRSVICIGLELTRNSENPHSDEAGPTCIEAEQKQGKRNFAKVAVSSLRPFPLTPVAQARFPHRK